MGETWIVERSHEEVQSPSVTTQAALPGGEYRACAAEPGSCLVIHHKLKSWIYVQRKQIQKDTCSPVLTAALFTRAKIWQQPKRLATMN